MSKKDCDSSCDFGPAAVAVAGTGPVFFGEGAGFSPNNTEVETGVVGRKINFFLGDGDCESECVDDDDEIGIDDDRCCRCIFFVLLPSSVR